MLPGGFVSICCSISDLVILFYVLPCDSYYEWLVVTVYLGGCVPGVHTVREAIQNAESMKGSEKMLMVFYNAVQTLRAQCGVTARHRCCFCSYLFIQSVIF